MVTMPNVHIHVQKTNIRQTVLHQPNVFLQTWDRDVSASRQILRLTLAQLEGVQQRPIALTRPNAYRKGGCSVPGTGLPSTALADAMR